jgi:hypothetical protein
MNLKFLVLDLQKWIQLKTQTSLMRYFFLQIILILITRSSIAQDYNFHNPIEGPMELTATFGELRPNHFHMGIDIATNRQIGKKLYAIESGYIARIKISPYGYGKAIYINHPQGLTTVYAHCDHFIPQLEKLIDSLHYKLKANELDLLLDSTFFQVTKGQHFAYSGNSGSSSGPHLHFEIRDTKTEIALNPLAYGFKIKDNTPPSIKSITFFCLDSLGYKINNTTYNIPVIKVDEHNYKLNPILLPNNFNYLGAHLGIAVETNDYMDGTSRNFGIYKTLLCSEHDTLMHTLIDSISFDNTRYINAHADYKQYNEFRRKSHNIYCSTSTPLKIYKDGKKGLLPYKNQDLTLYVSDFNKNTVKLLIPLRVPEAGIKKIPENYNDSYFMPEDSFIYETKWAKLSFPKHLVYEPEKKNIQSNSSNRTIQVGNKNTTIQSPYIIEYTLDSNIRDIEKHYLCVNNKHLETDIRENKLVAQSKSFGIIQVKTDFIQPIVSPINFTSNTTALATNKLVWKIKEEATSITSYNIYFNNQWQPLIYDPKNQTITCYLKPTMYGLQEIKLIVEDACGNKTEIEQTINLSKN